MKKTAIVTGSRRGIGLGIAKELLKNGYAVLLCATAEKEAVTDLMEELNRLGEADYIRCDISVPEDRRKLIAAADEKWGRLDVLVNNAGVACAVRLDVLETTEESFERLMRINLEGTFFMCQLGANKMIEMKKRGLADYTPRIINISSISAYTSSVSRGEYCISKAGISMTTQLFADRLAEEGIPVFEVRPGIILTDMTAVVKDKYEKLISEGITPIRRFGQPEDVAKCVLAACSGMLDFGTGTVLNADGGFHIQRL
ncbi:MAG: 3-ketoacyl-ACP reductase [Oscillospiraceae bacterium]|nr:3-ketoacyl-ACP reductase [Oscillospiraceae bacterium]